MDAKNKKKFFGSRHILSMTSSRQSQLHSCWNFRNDRIININTVHTVQCNINKLLNNEEQQRKLTDNWDNYNYNNWTNERCISKKIWDLSFDSLRIFFSQSLFSKPTKVSFTVRRFSRRQYKNALFSSLSRHFFATSLKSLSRDCLFPLITIRASVLTYFIYQKTVFTSKLINKEIIVKKESNL